MVGCGGAASWSSNCQLTDIIMLKDQSPLIIQIDDSWAVAVMVKNVTCHGHGQRSSKVRLALGPCVRRSRSELFSRQNLRQDVLAGKDMFLAGNSVSANPRVCPSVQMPIGRRRRAN